MDTEEQKQKVTSYFDESREWQGELYQPEESYFSRVIKRRKEYAFEMISSLPDLTRGKVLDVGFGSGVYLEEFLKMGFECYGTDISTEMVATATERFRATHDEERMHLYLGDVEHLPFEDAQFDLVICIGVLGYLLEDNTALAELKRVVKPGGYLLVNLTNMYSLSDADYVWRKKLASLVSGAEAKTAKRVPYAMPNEWMLTNRKFHFKSYNLWRYQKLVSEPNFVLVDAMTYGFEFRLLRKLKVIPARLLLGAELFLEKLFRAIPVPYFSYSGWVYTGIYKRRS